MTPPCPQCQRPTLKMHLLHYPWSVYICLECARTAEEVVDVR